MIYSIFTNINSWLCLELVDRLVVDNQPIDGVLTVCRGSTYRGWFKESVATVCNFGYVALKKVFILVKSCTGQIRWNFLLNFSPQCERLLNSKTTRWMTPLIYPTPSPHICCLLISFEYISITFLAFVFRTIFCNVALFVNLDRWCNQHANLSLMFPLGP